MAQPEKLPWGTEIHRGKTELEIFPHLIFSAHSVVKDLVHFVLGLFSECPSVPAPHMPLRTGELDIDPSRLNAQFCLHEFAQYL